MDQLPELVKSALSAACQSGKSLLLKIQESAKDTPIQLVWKYLPECPSASGTSAVVGSTGILVQNIWKAGKHKIGFLHLELAGMQNFHKIFWTENIDHCKWRAMSSPRKSHLQSLCEVHQQESVFVDQHLKLTG